MHGKRSCSPRPSTCAGDRADLAPLAGRAGRRVDTSGYEPRARRRLRGADAGHYVFVSSFNAYPDWPAQPVDEDSPTSEEGEGYGPQKVRASAAEAASRPRRGACARA